MAASWPPVNEETQPEAREHASGKRRWWIAAAVITPIVAVAFVAWLLLPGDSGTASPAPAAQDLQEEPSPVWSYSYAPRGDEEWISSYPDMRRLGDDRLAVLGELDTMRYAEQSGSPWYSGYDEHYTEGFHAGEQYAVDLEEYYNDPFDYEGPEQGEYFSLDGADHESAMSDPAYQGWFDGFEAASDELPEGTNKAERPDPPPTSGRLAVIDLDSGEEVWGVTMDTLGIEPGSSEVSLLSLSPEGHLPVVVTTPPTSGDSPTVDLFALDANSGDIVSQVKLTDSYIPASYAAQGAVIKVTEGGLARLDTAELDGEAVWQAAVDGLAEVEVDERYVRALTEDGEWWFDAETGFEPEWFDGPDPEVAYKLVGDDVVLRLEASSFGSYIDAMDMDGATLWTGDAEQVMVADGAGGTALFEAESTSEAESTGFEYLMRIDPESGEPTWDRGYEDDFGYVAGTVEDGVVLGEDERSTVVDLDTGERSQRFRGAVDVLGTSVAYSSQEGKLQAWSVEDGSELWSYRLNDGATLMEQSGRLLVRDDERRELTLLQ